MFRNDYSSQASINRTLIRIPNNAEGGTSESHTKAVSSIRFLEEHVAASSSIDGSIRLWDCTSPASIRSLPGIQSREGVSTLEVVRTWGDNCVLLSGAQSGSISMIDLRSRSGEGDKYVKAGASEITCIGLTDSFMFASGSASGRVELRDMRHLRSDPLQTFNSSRTILTQTHVGDSKRYSVPTYPKTVQISDDVWNIAMGKAPNRKVRHTEYSPSKDHVINSNSVFEEAHSGRVILTTFIDQKRILTVSADRSIKVFSESTGQILDEIKLKEKPSAATYFNGRLFIADRSGVVTIQEDRKGLKWRRRRFDNAHMGSVTSLCNCADWGLCTGGADQHVFLYSLDEIDPTHGSSN
jgi:WD40 repeat protein